MKPKFSLFFICLLVTLMACNDDAKDDMAETKTSESSQMSGPSKVKQLSDAFFTDVLENGDSSKLNEILADNFVSEDYPEPDANSNKVSFSKGVMDLVNGLENREVVIQAQAVKDNMIFTAGYMTGKHTGVLAGVPGTGKKIKVDFQDVWQEENGKLVKNWVVIDRLGMLQQIGAIPAPQKKRLSLVLPRRMAERHFISA